MPRPFALVLTLQYALVAAGVAQSNAPRELHKPIEKRDLPAQTLLWSLSRLMLGQAMPLYAEVIGNGTLAPTGTVTFEMAGKPFAIVPVVAVTNKNYLRYSSKFDTSAWTPPDKNGVLTPN